MPYPRACAGGNPADGMGIFRLPAWRRKPLLWHRLVGAAHLCRRFGKRAGAPCARRSQDRRLAGLADSFTNSGQACDWVAAWHQRMAMPIRRDTQRLAPVPGAVLASVGQAAVPPASFTAPKASPIGDYPSGVALGLRPPETVLIDERHRLSSGLMGPLRSMAADFPKVSVRRMVFGYCTDFLSAVHGCATRDSGGLCASAVAVSGGGGPVCTGIPFGLCSA